jgi:zinc transport system ATP-binding protein
VRVMIPDIKTAKNTKPFQPDLGLAVDGSEQLPVLDFRQACFTYDSQPALEDITFSVRPGEFTAVLGPNGSGKTTLLKLALGLLRPNRGMVNLFGDSPERFKRWQRVGYVSQTVEGLYSRFPATVEEIVAQGLYRGVDPLSVVRSPGRREVVVALEAAGIDHLRRRRISDISLGQQQRMLVARALISSPELLLLDEPVAGIDAAGQEQFHAMLRRLNQENGMAILIVSHDIGAVMREATTCACINRTMRFHGPAHRITSRELSDLYGVPVDVLIHDALHEHR